MENRVLTFFSTRLPSSLKLREGPFAHQEFGVVWRSPPRQPVSLGTVPGDSAASAKLSGDSRSLTVFGIHERRYDVPT